MQRIRLLTVALTAALLAGCTGARPTKAPDAPAAAASPLAGSGQAPAPESARQQPDLAESGDPRQGALWTGMLDGRKLYLYAADQKSWVEENPWCGAVKGETGHGGTYAWYVEPSPGAEPVRQALHLFSQWNSENGGGNLRFSGGMPLPATWEFRERTLVVVMQTANCNFKEYQFFGWDDQAGAMQQYAFQFAQGKQPTQWLLTGTAGVQGSHLVTRSYNNAQGAWTTRTWDVQGGTFVEIKTETDR